jgi:non-ribosomal peptide synthase protein (TIGR01720 family)
VLLAALAVAVRDWTGADDVVVDLEHHGRVAFPGLPSATGGIGWYTTISPILIPVGATWPAERLVDRIAAELRTRPNDGLGFGVLRYLDPDPATRARLATAKPPIRLNYRGRRDRLAAHDPLFEPVVTDVIQSSFPAGPRANDIEVVAEAVGDRLQISASYSAAQYREDTFGPFHNGFVRTLTVLTDREVR